MADNVPLYSNFNVRTHPLQRHEMEALIDRGESIMMPSGQVIQDKRHLPSEAELASGGTPEEKAAALANLRVEMDRMNAQIKALETGRPVPPTNPQPAGPVPAALAPLPAHVPTPTSSTAPAPAPAPAAHVADKDAARQSLLSTHPAAAPASTPANPPAGGGNKGPDRK